jgi:hypothetical protein
MRLISTETRALEEFIGDDIPRYAILSHTWGKDEISLQDLQRVMDPDLANDPKTWKVIHSAGFMKVFKFVELAASKGIPYAWADTCCIDKTSSADLMESINSMYRWYENADMCFAYLADVTSLVWSDLEVAKSRWFTRGWTLQELIAPSVVEFYNQSWNFLGNKYSETIDLEKMTGISRYILEYQDLSSANVAQKMSWAANRTTTRKEDIAYCLLGSFDVKMPLLYGEGEKAFLRLQEHIAATSTDHSLFAWGLQESGTWLRKARLERENELHRSIFAESPLDYVECGEMESLICAHPDTWTQTNRGFHATFPTISTEMAKELLDCDELPDYIDDDDYLAILNCGNRDHGYVVGIWITIVDPRNDGKDGFLRVSCHTPRLDRHKVFKKLKAFSNERKRDLWMATSKTAKVSPRHFSNRLGGFLISSGGISPKIYALNDTEIRDGGSLYKALLLTPDLPLDHLGGLVGVVTFRINLLYGNGKSEEEFAVVFGYPPSIKGPFTVIVEDFDCKAPFNYDFQQHAPFKMVKIQDGWFTRYAYNGDCLLQFIRVSLSTVLVNGMIFTELRMDVAPQKV